MSDPLSSSAPTPLACPICGAKPRVVQRNKMTWSVSCHADDSHSLIVYGGTEAEAIAAWHRRAPVAASPDEGRLGGLRRAKELAEDFRERGTVVPQDAWVAVGRVIDLIDAQIEADAARGQVQPGADPLSFDRSIARELVAAGFCLHRDMVKPLRGDQRAVNDLIEVEVNRVLAGSVPSSSPSPTTETPNV